MAVLAIDTSAAVSVALVDDDGGRLAVRTADERRRHAESLAPLIAEVLAAAGLERTDLTAVVGGTGPAPFTGLRVGLVTARTLALALGIEVLGVPSVDALAVEAVADLGLDPGDEVLVATDARRKEVYWARYRVVAHEGPHGLPVVEVLSGPEVATAAAVADAHLDAPAADGARLAVVGEGTSLYPDRLPAEEDAPVLPDATVLARLALARRAAGVEQPTEPLYLRRPDVQEPTGNRSILRAAGSGA
ncbi:tRNA (adenosine(37)-N6)-threonylcarbamoyltransferase complex dimerization subunit type 1 TsaB [Isoptericola sp. AK164]|uniref:tRNA (adenosine(37)-N6)-threonylcarbamoyltransferase complex dimerization subunit type 1 TsaB n=1 Tax=Isoptericola sp. AK164 TaxID=3024246 RepID=UPI00241884D6|nr:tRNA (adenosine(37)-N6)-threonylcarbamoyltransferase complex dimerization subunit type 1 TsaB [Isoptericola sp. AK164]